MSDSFVLTNLFCPLCKVRYQRGATIRTVKKGKNAVNWTMLSCRRFRDNAARIQSFAPAYNLANFLRHLVLPKSIQGWMLTTLQENGSRSGPRW
jgi:hypothetical protein